MTPEEQLVALLTAEKIAKAAMEAEEGYKAAAAAEKYANIVAEIGKTQKVVGAGEEKDPAEVETEAKAFLEGRGWKVTRG